MTFTVLTLCSIISRIYYSCLRSQGLYSGVMDLTGALLVCSPQSGSLTAIRFRILNHLCSKPVVAPCSTAVTEEMGSLG